MYFNNEELQCYTCFCQLLKADLETSIRSVTNKVTKTEFTQSLEFNQYFKQCKDNALNTNRPLLDGAVICV